MACRMIDVASVAWVSPRVAAVAVKCDSVLDRAVVVLLTGKLVGGTCCSVATDEAVVLSIIRHWT